MSKRLSNFIFSLVILFFIAQPVFAREEAPTPPTDKDRCAVCGMFVAKYQQWLTGLELDNGKTLWFDGVKDMMVYYFNPEQYGKPTDVAIKNILVKDYYNQQWVNGRLAFYVVGSDVLGPMGHELIPFETAEAAQAFSMDHHGKETLKFTDISSNRIESMRMGHKMNMKNMKSMKSMQ